MCTQRRFFWQQSAELSILGPVHHLIIRHRKENRKKCTLTPLENDPRYHFISYPFKTKLPSLTNYLLLAVDAPLLSPADKGHPLLLVDATWRYAEKILAQLTPTFARRSLPPEWETAYPRRQEVSSGLASIEALYVAALILGYSVDGLLDHYHWKEPFLEKNQHLIVNFWREKE